MLIILDILMTKVLVKDIMLRLIQTIGSDEKIALARLKMLRYGVGALPVVEKDRFLVGLITLRDINFAGNEIGSLLVRDLMTKDELITGTPKTLIKDIADMMIKTGIQRIPILDENNRLVGLVTQSVVIRTLRDLLKE